MARGAETQVVITARDKTGAAFRSVNNGLREIDGRVGVLTRGMGGLAAAAGLGALATGLKSATADIAKLADTADRIGLTTNELQELQHAAQQTGVDTGVLNMAMQRFTRRVAEAHQGAGELKGTLELYGIATKDANGQNRKAIDVLGDLADRIKNTESEQEALRIAFKAFDSEGATLVNTLRNGAEGLAEYRKQAHEFGVVIERDAIEAARNFDTMLDTLARRISINLKSSLAEGIRDIGAFADALSAVTGAAVDGFDDPLIGLENKLIGRQTVLRNMLKDRPGADNAKRQEALAPKIAETRREIAELEAKIKAIRTERAPAAPADPASAKSPGAGLTPADLDAREKAAEALEKLRMQEAQAGATGQALYRLQAIQKLGVGATEEQIAAATKSIAAAAALKDAATKRQAASRAAIALSKKEADEIEKRAKREYELFNQIIDGLANESASLQLEARMLDASEGARARANAALEIDNRLREENIILSESGKEVLKAYLDELERSADVNAAAAAAKKKADDAAKKLDTDRKKATDDIKRANEELGQSYERLAADGLGTFADLATGAKDWKQALSDLLPLLADVAFKMLDLRDAEAKAGAIGAPRPKDASGALGGFIAKAFGIGGDSGGDNGVGTAAATPGINPAAVSPASSTFDSAAFFAVDAYAVALEDAGPKVADRAAPPALEALELLGQDIGDGLADAASIAGDGFGDLISTVVEGLEALFSEAAGAGGGGGGFGDIFGSLFGGSGGGTPGASTSGSSGLPASFHTGGDIGTAPFTPNIGLRSDERLIVGQTGERVMNRRETAALDRMERRGLNLQRFHDGGMIGGGGGVAAAMSGLALEAPAARSGGDTFTVAQTIDISVSGGGDDRDLEARLQKATADGARQGAQAALRQVTRLADQGGAFAKTVGRR